MVQSHAHQNKSREENKGLRATRQDTQYTLILRAIAVHMEGNQYFTVWSNPLLEKKHRKFVF